MVNCPPNAERDIAIRRMHEALHYADLSMLRQLRGLAMGIQRPKSGWGGIGGCEKVGEEEVPLTEPGG